MSRTCCDIYAEQLTVTFMLNNDNRGGGKVYHQAPMFSVNVSANC